MTYLLGAVKILDLKNQEHRPRGSEFLYDPNFTLLTILTKIETALVAGPQQQPTSCMMGTFRYSLTKPEELSAKPYVAACFSAERELNFNSAGGQETMKVLAAHFGPGRFIAQSSNVSSFPTHGSDSQYGDSPRTCAVVDDSTRQADLVTLVNENSLAPADKGTPLPFRLWSPVSRHLLNHTGAVVVAPHSLILFATGARRLYVFVVCIGRGVYIVWSSSPEPMREAAFALNSVKYEGHKTPHHNSILYTEQVLENDMLWVDLGRLIPRAMRSWNSPWHLGNFQSELYGRTYKAFRQKNQLPAGEVPAGVLSTHLAMEIKQ